MTNPVIRITELAKAYGQPGRRTTALAGVTLELNLGEVVLLRGRSGSGKTTLLNVVAGWVEPDSGTVEWEAGGHSGNRRWDQVAIVPQTLGLLEATVPDSPNSAMFREVVGITANVLSPLLASAELSEDLASEVALKTRETELQRRFTSKIIDSLPVGLYVIDRDYTIQAWNRKREVGAQGIERDEALGRHVFDVLNRQPKGLLQFEFDSLQDQTLT